MLCHPAAIGFFYLTCQQKTALVTVGYSRYPAPVVILTAALAAALGSTSGQFGHKSSTRSGEKLSMFARRHRISMSRREFSAKIVKIMKLLLFRRVQRHTGELFANVHRGIGIVHKQSIRGQFSV
jgi:hypothetical protein